jgi:hypothetical protein
MTHSLHLIDNYSEYCTSQHSSVGPLKAVWAGLRTLHQCFLRHGPPILTGPGEAKLRTNETNREGHPIQRKNQPLPCGDRTQVQRRQPVRTVTPALGPFLRTGLHTAAVAFTSIMDYVQLLAAFTSSVIHSRSWTTLPDKPG